jgi:hypothetical protein
LKKLLIYFFLSFFCFYSFAQTRIDSAKFIKDITKKSLTDIKKDSTKKDSTQIKKDSAGIKKDTTIENKFAANYYLDNSQGSIKLDRDQIILSDYYSFSDLLQKVNGYYISDLGNPGQINPLFYQGVSSKNSSVMVDGIPYNNSFFGVPDQSLVMTEDIEKIEVLPAGQSQMFGNSNTINIITNKKNSNKPYTYIRHIEAPYSTYLTDGVFMRNISSRSNLIAGFNYQTSLGRFTNSDYAFFGGRLRYRYILSDKMELNISDYFTRNDRGLNGGIKLTNNVLTDESFNGNAAEVNYPNSREKFNRNLLNAQLSGFFFGDSINSSLITFSYNSEKDEIKDKIEINSVTQDFTQPIKTNSFFFSFKQRYVLPANDFTLYISALQKSTDDFYALVDEYSPYLVKDMIDFHINMSLYDNVSISDKLKINFGIGLLLPNGDYIPPVSHRLSFSVNPVVYLGNFIFSAEAARSYRQPTSYEKYLANIYNYVDYGIPEKQSNYSINASYKDKTSNLGLSLFCKNSSNYFLPGVFFNDKAMDNTINIFNTSQTIYGFSFNCNIEYDKILFESKIEYNHFNGSPLEKVIPEFIGNAGIYYFNRIFTDDIKIKIGINGKYYSPISDLMARAAEAYINSEVYGPDYSPKGILNLLAVLKIQTATVYFGVENLLDRNYFITRVYPMNDRSFKLAVSWAFWD